VIDVSPSARGVYGIALAAEMAGVGEQTLRLYERKGLITPARTAGGTRRYSEDDVTLLRRVVELLADGLNLAGVRRVLDLETTNSQLRERLARLTGVDAGRRD
jgi:MerR family transcriptional regulator/heat shock protein HspR